MQVALLKYCKENNIRGTILLALEGINSTMAGAPDDIDAFCDF